MNIQENLADITVRETMRKLAGETLEWVSLAKFKERVRYIAENGTPDMLRLYLSEWLVDDLIAIKKVIR